MKLELLVVLGLFAVLVVSGCTENLNEQNSENYIDSETGSGVILTTEKSVATTIKDSCGKYDVRGTKTALNYKRCMVDYYIDLALISGNLSICDELGEIYPDVTSLKEKHLSWMSYSDTTSKSYCYAVLVSKYPNIPEGVCKELGSGYKTCLISYAMTHNKPELCSEMTLGKKNYCIREVAFKNENYSMCLLIVGDNYVERTYCGSKLFHSLWPDNKDEFTEEICNLLSDLQALTGDRDICYNEVAISNKDTSLCNKLSTQDGKDECISTIEYLS